MYIVSDHNSTATSGPKQSESYKVVHLQKSISVKIMHEAYLSSCNSNEPGRYFLSISKWLTFTRYTLLK